MEQSAFIFRIVTITLALILLSMVLAMLYGLFDERVDNKAIFAILGPAFQTITGCFVGILGGRALARREE